MIYFASIQIQLYINFSICQIKNDITLFHFLCNTMREHKLIFSVKCIHFIFLDLSFIYTIRISPITCWLASRARRALGARQHVIGLYSHENCSNGLTITTGSCLSIVGDIDWVSNLRVGNIWVAFLRAVIVLES